MTARLWGGPEELAGGRDRGCRIAFIGTHVPRRCGLATFTADLATAMAAGRDSPEVLVVAVNDRPGVYTYPDRVRFEIEEQDLQSYHRAADFLNESAIDCVNVQHEFGIYGGSAGRYVIELLRDLRVPVITTLHTVLRRPDKEQRRVMRELDACSDRFVVMGRRAVELLESTCAISPEKVDLIPHGIPEVAFVDPGASKERLGLAGKRVLLTFGLLSPNKGIEHVIRALPSIVASHPDVVYVVLGATHPHVKRDSGEQYRISLRHLAEELGVAGHVIFHDRFVPLQDLVEFIGAADIYVTPYLNEEQITSGTLAYAVGAGKAVISTPYWHAQELLADGRGRLVPFADPDAVAANVRDLLSDEAVLHRMRRRAYEHTRHTVWAAVATAYRECFVRAGLDRAGRFTATPISRRREPGRLTRTFRSGRGEPASS